MSAFVTGAGGFLGRSVVWRLFARGEREVRCLIRRPGQAGALRKIAAGFEGARLECVVGDLNTRAALERGLDGADAVFHLAASMKGSFSDMVMGTVVGSKRLIDAHADVNPRAGVTLVSSFAVYGTAVLPPGGLVDENTPLEPRPTQRGAYCYAKLRQERLFREHARENGTPLAVVRPGVVYGPGGVTFSPRVGVQLPGVFLHIGRGNTIPLTYVDNCADAVVLAPRADGGQGAVYNVVDDDLPSAAEYLRAYRHGVRRMRTVTVPYPVMRVVAGWVEGYHRRSRGQLPAFFTRYKTDTNWKPCTFTNARLKSVGWKPLVSTHEGIERTFAFAREHPEG